MVMWPILYHLRSHIFQRTTKRIPLFFKISLHGPSKIADFDDISFFDQNILWFDISMDQSLLMHVVYTRAGLYKEFESELLSQVLLFTNHEKEIANAGIFQG